jgi:hypothetical protein
MQTSAFGKSKGLRATLAEGTWLEAFDGLGISLILTCNPSIQVQRFCIVQILSFFCMYRNICTEMLLKMAVIQSFICKL